MEDDDLRDVFAGLGAITIRRMFGGKALYSQGMIFALYAFEQVWIKADEVSQPEFEAAGSGRFGYTGKNGEVALPYWQLPDDALEDRDAALRWARLGLAAAARRAADRPKKTRRKKGA